MLYQMVELQRALSAPMTAAAGNLAKAFTNPANPFAMMPGAARFAAGLELVYQLGKQYSKPAPPVATRLPWLQPRDPCAAFHDVLPPPIRS